MKIRSVAHRGLRRFMQHNDPSGLAPSVVEKGRNILTFLQEMEDSQELRDVPSWNTHQLTGDRKGGWSLTVTRIIGSRSRSTRPKEKYWTWIMKITIERKQNHDAYGASGPSGTVHQDGSD